MILAAKYLLLSLLILSATSSVAQNTKGITEENQPDEVIGKSRALIIGISKYEHVESLEYADKDALEFSRFLIGNKFWNIPSEDISLLTNEKAKCGDVISELGRLAQVSKKGDRLIFYFSGHGDVETITQFNNGYLLMNDTYKNNYITGAIPINFLKEVVVTLIDKGVKVYMFIDACRSGKLAGGPKGAEFATAALTHMWNNEIKILSSQPGKLSREGKEWGNGRGVFSYYLTLGLSGAADYIKDSVITLSELEMYVLNNVANATGKEQQPMFEGPDKFTTAMSRIYPAKSSPPGGKAFRSKIKKYYIPLDSCMEYYKKMDHAIEQNLLTGTNSAMAYYQKLKFCSQDTDIVFRANSKLLGGLMDNIQRIVNNTLIGKKLMREDMCDLGAVLVDAALMNNDLHIPVDHLKNVKRYLMVIKYALWEYSPSVANQLPVFEGMLDSALKTEPDAAYLLNAKGILFLRLHDYINAESHLEKALEHSPTWLMPRYFLGINYSQQKNYSKAIKYYEEVLNGDSSFATFECTKCIIQEMANMAEELKEYEKAKLYYKKNIELFPDYWTSYDDFADLIIRTKDKNAATEFMGLLSGMNDSIDARMTRIRMMIHFNNRNKGKIQDAIDSLADLSKTPDQLADLDVLTAEFEASQMHYHEALEAYRSAVGRVPDDPYYIGQLIDYLILYAKFDDLEKLINEVKDRYSTNDQQKLSYAMCMVYLARKKNAEAFEEFKKLHASGYITCNELKDIKPLKKVEGFATYIKNCK